MRRFFIDPETVTGQTVLLSGSEARHISAVLRLQTGQIIEFFDGTGRVYRAKLTRISGREVAANIVSQFQPPQDKAAPLTLAQGILKGKKMDLLIQKATELGVITLQPVVSKYCDKGGRRENQLERWRRITIEACKQCHRVHPMDIAPAVPVTELDVSRFSHKILPWEGERESSLASAALTRDSGSICLLIGPEGGFHEEEIQWARTVGFQTVSLGDRILRAETAALAAIAVVRYLTGSLSPSHE